jgi:hypothetical protein
MEHARDALPVFKRFHDFATWWMKTGRNDTSDFKTRIDSINWFLHPDKLAFNAGSAGNAPMSLFVAVYDSNGNRRLYKNKPAGINRIMRHILQQKPNHFRGGVARSNLMYHNHRSIYPGKGHDCLDQRRIMVPRYRHAMKFTLQAMDRFGRETGLVRYDE